MAGYLERSEVRGATRFSASSMTKPITATASMILAEECRLRLDEPVDCLLPELANSGRCCWTRADPATSAYCPGLRLR
ncbi:MAG TPA: serine hydrolase [Dehalococcoidia bacterium]|nr:serine hydrolase [Dehalococcoidia bacterium]